MGTRIFTNNNLITCSKRYSSFLRDMRRTTIGKKSSSSTPTCHPLL